MDIFPEFFLRTDVLEAIFLTSTCEQLSLVVVPVRRNNTLPSSNPDIFFLLQEGKSLTCGCAYGLTCAIVDKDRRTGAEKFRCVQIPPEIKEQWEQDLFNGTLKRYITAIELKKILSILREQGKSGT